MKDFMVALIGLCIIFVIVILSLAVKTAMNKEREYPPKEITPNAYVTVRHRPICWHCHEEIRL